jgi:hypothetical protein
MVLYHLYKYFLNNSLIYHIRVYINISIIPLFKGVFIMNIIIDEKAKEKLDMMGKNVMTIYLEPVSSC